MIGEQGDDAALQRSVEAFEAALEVFTRDREPSTWAITQANLGGVLKVLFARGNIAALAHSLKAHEMALTVITRERTPMEWAKIQVNYGTVLAASGALQRSSEAFKGKRRLGGTSFLLTE